MKRFLNTVSSLFFFLFFSLSSWLCSVPMWLTLILHFVLGLSIWWFWGTLIAWLLVGLLRFCLIRFGRWGAKETAAAPPRKNRNPYSAKNSDFEQRR